MMRTQVGIVGAGPAGLVLALLLRRRGIDAVIVENKSRDYIEHRVRAGLLEQWVSDLLVDIGVGERLEREAMFHDGIHLAFSGAAHHLDFRTLIGKGVTVYGQQEVVKDLVAKLLADGVPLLFEADDVAVHGVDGDQPTITFRHDGAAHEIACDFIGGCDGFHGICRPSIPPGVLTTFDRDYPFGWLGILTESPPPADELIYAYHDRGFALYSMRSPTVSRLYVQVGHDEDIERWPDTRVWDELNIRLGGVRSLAEGRVLQKSLTPMRSFVTEPMQYGRLFLAGDAAHIVPPTGAKGMNLAVADVVVLARAIADYYASGRTELLTAYSKTCLDRIWKGQRFSWWMTQMLHRFPDGGSFDRRRQVAELSYVVGSTAAATSLAENYAGLPMQM
jgi:p-hydroxybenzoate 3-monooxygenase